MSSLNKVALIGYLGRDPERRNFSNGGAVVNLRVACTDKWKDKNSGEWKERTEWVSVAIFNEGSQRFAEQYLKKGSMVYIEGKLQTRKYQAQDGSDRYSTEVVLHPYESTLKGLDRKQDGHGQSSGGYGQGYGSSSNYQAPPASDLDDEIGF